MGEKKGDPVIGPLREALTLQSIAEGAAETMFQDELSNVDDVIDRNHLFAEDSHGDIKSRITLEIDLLYNIDTNQIRAQVATGFKRPKRRAIQRPVFKGDDGWSALVDPDQMSFGEVERREADDENAS